MSEPNDLRIREFIRKAIAPVGDSELRRDLWPRMLSRLHERPAPVPWFDWAVVALLAGIILVFPEVIPALLYHL